MDILLELGWIKPRGRRRTPGRPLTWGTTPGFLDHFGLASVTDLPGVDELRSAGLLRKGEILGAQMDSIEEIDDEMAPQEEGFLSDGFDGDDNASI